MFCLLFNAKYSNLEKAIKKDNMFIAFEGLDGSGQTTQVEKLGAWFRQRGSSVVLTKEPTEESPFAALIRQVIRRKDIKLMPLTLQGLLIEDRRWHLNTVIEPAL